MAAEIDIRAIATFSSTSEGAISTLLDKPTVELVRALLHNISAKAHEYGQLKSQKFRLEVELETAVRTSESKVKALKASVEKGLTEVTRLRNELQNSENARWKAENEIEQIRSANSQDAGEVSTLKSRVSSLEAANRDTLAVLDSKSTAYDQLAEELSSQQRKAQTLRRRVSELEQNLQSANSAAASTRFREQSLQQELELLKRNNEWFESELNTKNADHVKFRKDKATRVTELQQLNEQYISEAESLKRSEAALRSRLDDQIQKLEDSLTTIQELREEAVQTADAFRVELDSAGRLAELQKASADTAKHRAQELSIALEEAKEDAADEIGRLRAEVETEHSDKVTAEQRVTELESNIEQLQSELELVKAQPNTPQRINGHGVVTPSRPGTPIGVFSPGSASRIKGNLSMTQLFTEYKKVERELTSEKRHSEQLSKSLEEMVENLEKTQPEIDELRADHGRLQGEMIEISTLRDVATKERDNAIRESRKLQGQFEVLRKERDVFQQQVRDTSSQIKILLMEQHLRENGQQLSQEEMNELHQAAIGDVNDLAAMSDTGRIISENLTVFRNIVELQEQNNKIQSMLRQLGERMEISEAHERNPARRQEHQELEALRARVSTYKDELQNMVTQSKSYVKERDMFRNMLVRRGQLPAQIEAGAFAQSMPLPAADSPPRGFAGSLQGQTMGTELDYAKLLKDLQHHFDSYKQEAATDNTALKNQLNDLSKRNSQLQIELSKQLGQLSAANQRGEMLQANYNMLKAESLELQKRSESIRENATKQELRTQQAAEELVEVKGQVDSMRRENANLKAEKDLWKSIERRLMDDNESLRNERGRLDSLNSTLQNLLNEREQSDSESHRRLQTQIESLVSELQTTKRKLNDEIEEGKKTTLRREYEHEQNQKRIDDLMASLGSLREESIQAKTTRDHLQARVDEMTIELRSAEERLHVLQAKSTVDTATGDAAGEEESLTREQELSIEISELKRDLELKNTELERVSEQVETYKSISQASEERLQELSDTNDQYREETERTMEDKDTNTRELESRVEDISTELITTNNELTRLRDDQSVSERRLEEQRLSFESDIARLKDQVDQQTIRAEALLADVKSQANIANEYQQNYENELVKHAEAAKTLQTIRTENNQLRLDMVEFRTTAESATTSLVQKEESWFEQKSRYERELVDLRRRREEVLQQNTLLHGQLEEVTKQITSLQRGRDSHTEEESGTMPGPALENLQEVIKYLRREKEIVDVQYHLSTQEGKRLKQQLDHTQWQLDETRLKLDQQLRAEADTERNALSHNKLMDTLNELNLYRESSVTLRAEAKRASNALAEKSQRVEELVAEMAPLQTRISELENLSELREGEMKLLQEDRDHWQARTQNILAKYDRVDPADLETLKEKLSTLETERDEAVATRDALQAQIDTIPQQVENAKQDLRGRLSEQFKARNKDLTGRINQKQTELDTANSEKADLQTELESTREQLKSFQDQPAPPQTNGVQEVTSPNAAQPTQLNTDAAPQLQDLSAKISELEAELVAKDQEIDQLKAEKDSAFKTREAELRVMLNKRLAEVKAELQAASADTVKELEEKLRTKQAEIEAFRTEKTASHDNPSTNGPVLSTEKVVEPQSVATRAELPSLTEEQIKDFVRENETIRSMIRTNIRKSVDKEKEAFRKELEAAQIASGQPASNTTTEDFDKRWAAEKESLIKELDLKFESDKQAIIKAQEEKCAAEKQVLLSGQEDKIASEKQVAIITLQEKFSEERLIFSKESERRIADQVALAEKRNAAKANMATNQVKNMNAKMQIVSNAATETPDKPVSEVWEIARYAKPPPFGIAAPKAATPVPASKAPSSGVHEKPVVEGTVPIEVASTSQKHASTAEDEMAKSEPMAAAGGDTTTSTTNPPLPQTSAIPKIASTTDTGTGPAVLRSLHSNLPRGGRAGRGGGPSQGASTSETQQQPQPAASRGSGIPRGGSRGRGPSRGAGQQIQVDAPRGVGQGQGVGSPRGSLNPNATQFNPNGNKRSREDGPGEDQGGKRIRGGGGGN